MDWFSLQGSSSQDVANVCMLPMIYSIKNSPSSYYPASTLKLFGRALTSRSHYALSFPIVQLSKAPSVNCQRMFCVNSMAKVSDFFQLFKPKSESVIGMINKQGIQYFSLFVALAFIKYFQSGNDNAFTIFVRNHVEPCL